jgi:hypothetical protein
MQSAGIKLSHVSTLKSYGTFVRNISKQLKFLRIMYSNQVGKSANTFNEEAIGDN